MAKTNKVIVPRTATRNIGSIPFGSILEHKGNVCILSYWPGLRTEVVLVRLEDGVNIHVGLDEIGTILDEVTIIREK